MTSPNYHFIEFIYTSAVHQIVVKDKSAAKVGFARLRNFFLKVAIGFLDSSFKDDEIQAGNLIFFKWCK